MGIAESLGIKLQLNVHFSLQVFRFRQQLLSCDRGDFVFESEHDRVSSFYFETEEPILKFEC